MDKLPNFREDTVATWLYGKLLIQQIARKIVSPSVAPPSTSSCSPPPPDQTREKLRQLTGRVVHEMWRVMVLVYEAIHAALLPVTLSDLPNLLRAFVEHVARRNERRRPKQTETFRARLQALPIAPPQRRRSPSSARSGPVTLRGLA